MFYDNQMQNIVRHAYSKSPLYVRKRKKLNLDIEDILSDWNKVPIIKKDDMLYSSTSAIPYNYFARMETDDIQHEITSGSTGKCLDVYWKKTDLRNSLLPLWLYRKKYYGISAKDRFCYFYTIQNLTSQDPEYVRERNSIGFSKQNLNMDRLKEIYSKMYEFQPVWMMLQPSIASLLAKFIFESGVERIKSLKYIELTGEMLFENNRRFIQSAFGCLVANQYGCNEVGSIAYECPCGKLHILDSNVHVDIMDNKENVEDGEEGKVIVTSKQNFVMPFIKYDVGDYAKISLKKCKCGNSGRILELTKGRDNDFIATKDGTQISVYEFIRAFHVVSDKIDGDIYQYQIIQHSYDHFEIKLVTNEKADIIEKIFLQAMSKSVLKNSFFEFRYFENLLKKTETKKLRIFKNEIL